MQSGKKQNTAKIDYLLVIHLQSFDGGASGRCKTDNQQSVFTPGEMILPSLFAGIEERRKLLSHWIDARDFAVLAAVTCQAGRGEIIKSGLAAF